MDRHRQGENGAHECVTSTTDLVPSSEAAWHGRGHQCACSGRDSAKVLVAPDREAAAAYANGM